MGKPKPDVCEAILRNAQDTYETTQFIAIIEDSGLLDGLKRGLIKASYTRIQNNSIRTAALIQRHGGC